MGRGDRLGLLVGLWGELRLWMGSGPSEIDTCECVLGAPEKEMCTR